MKSPGSRWLGALAAVAVAVAGCSGSPSPSTVPAANQTASVPPASNQPSQPVQPDQGRGRSPRIMIVGDSVTQGSAGDYTWQYWLYEHLKADGISPRMVGPNHSLYNNVTRALGDLSYANPHFGRANDTIWGMTLAREKTAIGGKVKTYRPDYLLVLLGLNDLFWFGTSQPVMAANLATFIATARAAQPRIRIAFGLIPPDIHTETSPTFSANVVTFNAAIVGVAARLTSAESPIAVAQDTDIDVATDLRDGTHPNTNGQIRIAAAFADALASKLGLGAAYPTPFPVMPVGPLTHPKLKVTPSRVHGQAKLTWTLVPGASSYFVYVKQVTVGQSAFNRLPIPLPPGKDPFTAGLLNPGGPYSFKVQACKGSDCGAFSNVASIVAP